MKPHTHPCHCQRLKAWILASLLLAMGWAWALPLVQPTQLRLVCSGATGAMQLRTLEARHGLQQADAAAERIFEVLDAHSEHLAQFARLREAALDLVEDEAKHDAFQNRFRERENQQV